MTELILKRSEPQGLDESLGQRQAHRRPSERFGCQYSLIDRLIVDVSDMTSFNIHSNNQRICMACFKLGFILPLKRRLPASSGTCVVESNR